MSSHILILNDSYTPLSDTFEAPLGLQIMSCFEFRDLFHDNQITSCQEFIFRTVLQTGTTKGGA